MRSTLAFFAIASLLVSMDCVPCFADQQSMRAELVEILPLTPLPFILKGYLRRPAAAGPLPAVVLLPGCDAVVKPIDENWGEKISSWGYVTLTVDSFSSRGIKGTCDRPAPLEIAFDIYRGLNFLRQQGFVNPKRVVVVGIGQGGTLTLSAVERGIIEQQAKNKFRAAVAFYPFCGASKGILTIPTMILVGERDDWAPADACRKLAEGHDDMGISRQKGDGAAVRLTVLPDAYHGFDLRFYQTPSLIAGHRHEFNELAADQSSIALREFLHSMFEERP